MIGSRRATTLPTRPPGRPWPVANQQREVGSLAQIDLEFRLLGPLEFVRGGAPIPVGQGRERSLLALLLLHANQVVSTDGLVDRLWGEDPPASAAHALQVHISNLRKALEPDRPKGSPGPGPDHPEAGVSDSCRARPTRRRSLRGARRGRPGAVPGRAVRRRVERARRSAGGVARRRPGGRGRRVVGAGRDRPTGGDAPRGGRGSRRRRSGSRCCMRLSSASSTRSPAPIRCANACGRS